MIEIGQEFLEKALESLEGAESEQVNKRYNNCANRCYYATFQSAIYALIRARIQPPSSPRQREYWTHTYVQSMFDGLLINRRKIYPTDLRGILDTNYLLRETGDYYRESVSRRDASRALGRTKLFMQVIRFEGAEG